MPVMVPGTCGLTGKKLCLDLPVPFCDLVLGDREPEQVPFGHPAARDPAGNSVLVLILELRPHILITGGVMQVVKHVL